MNTEDIEQELKDIKKVLVLIHDYGVCSSKCPTELRDEYKVLRDKWAEEVAQDGDLHE